MPVRLIVLTGKVNFVGSPSMLPSLRSNSVQHQTSLLPEASTPTHVLLVALTLIESVDEDGSDREAGELVGWNEGPRVIEERGV